MGKIENVECETFVLFQPSKQTNESENKKSVKIAKRDNC